MTHLEILKTKTPEEQYQWLIENKNLILKKTEIDLALVLVLAEDQNKPSYGLHEIIVIGGPLNFYGLYTELLSTAIEIHNEFIVEIKTYSSYETIISINPDWNTSLPVYSDEFRDFSKVTLIGNFQFTESDRIMFEYQKDAAIFMLSHYYNENMKVVK